MLSLTKPLLVVKVVMMMEVGQSVELGFLLKSPIPPLCGSKCSAHAQNERGKSKRCVLRSVKAQRDQAKQCKISQMLEYTAQQLVFLATLLSIPTYTDVQPEVMYFIRLLSVLYIEEP